MVFECKKKELSVGEEKKQVDTHTRIYFLFVLFARESVFSRFSLSFSLVVQVKFGDEDVKFDWIYVKLGLPSYNFWPLHTGLPSVFKTTKQSSRRRLN